jgi:hypothetical protein
MKKWSADQDKNEAALTASKSPHYSNAANDIDHGLRWTKSMDDDELVIVSMRSQ